AAGTGYDQLNVTGTVTLQSVALNLAMSPSFVPAVGQEFVLIANDGVDLPSGTFNGMPEGTIVTLNGTEFVLSYSRGANHNSVTLSVIVVPKTWTGAVNNLWSVGGNWTGGVPQSGDAIQFP